MIKLIAIDVDDTLLDPHGRLTDRTAQTLNEAVQRGIRIVLCTGRPLVGVNRFLRRIGLAGPDQYTITYNGAIVQNLAGGIVVKHTLNRSDYLDVAAFADQHHVHYNGVDGNGRIFTGNMDVGAVTVIQAWENHAGVAVLDPTQIADDLVIPKVLLGDSADKIDAVVTPFLQWFGARFYTVRSTPTFFEVLAPMVNKGAALRELCRQLNISTTEVMAIGDEHNDLSMFDVAGYAVAMGNARRDVRTAATIVTADNAHDGVAQVVERCLGGEF